MVGQVFWISLIHKTIQFSTRALGIILQFSQGQITTEEQKVTNITMNKPNTEIIWTRQQANWRCAVSYLHRGGSVLWVLLQTVLHQALKAWPWGTVVVLYWV